MPEKKESRRDRFIWHEGDLRISQCAYCKWKHRGSTCEALPGGIPMEILTNDFDHREPYPGDRGLRFETTSDAAT